MPADSGKLGKLAARQSRLFFKENRTPQEQAELEANRDLGLLMNMGLTPAESIGMGVGDRKAMEHLLRFRGQFDFEKKEFV